jgi:hypothetical protein
MMSAAMSASPRALALLLASPLAVLTGTAGLAACNRSPAAAEIPAASGPASAASASPSPSAEASAAPPEASAEAPLALPSTSAPGPRAPAANLPLAAVEARRTSLRRLDEERALLPQEARLREHFGGDIPFPLELQTAPLPGDRRALLVYGEPRRRNPFLLVTGAAGEPSWTKERPLAGTRQVVTEMVVAPGPDSEVALLWCDIPTQVVGLRKWAADGIVLADFQVLEVDVCEALSALYWPGRGFLAVASQHGAARAQLLDERGKRAWGPKGNELPWTARPSSPASIAVDADASVMLFQVGDRPTADAPIPDRVLVMRYDTLGTALWERPLDLGPAPAGAGGGAARIAVTRVAPGEVKVSLGARGSATVTSAGSILGAR